MKPEFHYIRKEADAPFEVICGTPNAAVALLLEFPTICGVIPELDGDTLTFELGLDRLDEALVLIEAAGYETVDLLTGDDDYDTQDGASPGDES